MTEQAENPPARSIGPWILLVLAIAFSVGVRWRLREMPLERDEGEYAYAGQLILQGIPPFREAYNMKFPGTYAAYAGMLAVFGQTPAGVHIGTMLVNAVTIVLIFFLTRQLLNDLAAGCAALVYAILTLDNNSLGLAGHATHFVVLAAIAGLIVLLRALRRPSLLLLFVSGVLLGISTLMKQPGVFFVAFAGVWMLVHHRREGPIHWRRLLRDWSLLASGALLPLLLTFLILWRAGVFAKFWFWTITYARQYGTEVSLDEAPAMLGRGFLDVAHCSYPLWILATTGAVLAWLSPTLRRATLFILLLLAFSFLGTSAGFYYRHHYFILTMPALAMLVGAGATAVHDRWRHTILPIAIVLLACALVIFPQRDFLFRLTPEQACRARYDGNPFIESIPIARYLAEHTAPDEPIAVLGSEPQIFFYAHRHSASGFIYPCELMEDQPYALQMQHEMAADIERARPKFIVFVKIPTSWLMDTRSNPWIFNWFAEYQKHYDLVGIIEPGEQGSTYRWDDQAKGLELPRGFYVAVLRRKTSG